MKINIIAGFFHCIVLLHISSVFLRWSNLAKRYFDLRDYYCDQLCIVGENAVLFNLSTNNHLLIILEKHVLYNVFRMYYIKIASNP